MPKEPASQRPPEQTGSASSAEDASECSPDEFISEEKGEIILEAEQVRETETAEQTSVESAADEPLRKAPSSSDDRFREQGEGERLER